MDPERNDRTERKPEREDLRDLLRLSDVADWNDQALQHRCGAFIARAVFDPTRQTW
jgi:hypothetical protein